MEKAPTFTVIMVDYEDAVPRHRFQNAVDSLGYQSFQDFELLIYHDGPKKVSYWDELAPCHKPRNTRTFVTDARDNDWGHSNRNRGIFEAKGDWIIHTNADNVFYDFALQELAATAMFESWALTPDKEPTTDIQAMVYPIILRGQTAWQNRWSRQHGQEEKFSMVLSGVPVKKNRIDAMQFVMKRDLWLAEGGWLSKEINSDSEMYEEFAKKYAVCQITRILAEHW